MFFRWVPQVVDLSAPQDLGQVMKDLASDPAKVLDIHPAGRTWFNPLRLRLVGDGMDCAESYHLGTDRAETLPIKRSFRAQYYKCQICKGSIYPSHQRNPRRGLGTYVRSGV
jgi:hypothetical protein